MSVNVSLLYFSLCSGILTVYFLFTLVAKIVSGISWSIQSEALNLVWILVHFVVTFAWSYLLRTEHSEFVHCLVLLCPSCRHYVFGLSVCLCVCVHTCTTGPRHSPSKSNLECHRLRVLIFCWQGWRWLIKKSANIAHLTWFTIWLDSWGKGRQIFITVTFIIYICYSLVICWYIKRA